MKKDKTEILENNEALETSKKENKIKAKKPKKIKNQALLKRGGYAMAITAAVLAGIVVLNILMGVLAKRFDLEFDMTVDKKNSIVQENIDYIETIDKEITVTVCANKSDYMSYMSTQYAPKMYKVIDGRSDYYDQTITLIERYVAYNDKITIKYVDMYDDKDEYTELTRKYPEENIGYGDLVVTCDVGGTERHKVVGFQDIYALEENETYAMYGVTGYYSVVGNNIETALTSAIAYVVSSDDKKVAFITGHSKVDYTESYRKLLKNNNYKVDVIADEYIAELSDEYDAIFIAAPTRDFTADELDIISKYLDNDGKYGKSLVYFADAASPYLPDFSAFLEEWGITVHEAYLHETYSGAHAYNDPTTFLSGAIADDTILNGIGDCWSGTNVALTTAFDSHNAITTTKLIGTLPTVVSLDYDFTEEEIEEKIKSDKFKQSFPTVLQAKRFNYDNDNNPIQNHVFAFSSIEFIHGEYSDSTGTSNTKIAFKVAERAVGVDDSGIMFDTKTIEVENFKVGITDDDINTVLIVFMFIFPLSIVVIGVIVFIRRKNS